MLAFRQIIDDPLDVISVPSELRHRPTEVIFIALETPTEDQFVNNLALAPLAGSWEGDDGQNLNEVEPIIADEGGVWVAQVTAIGDLEAAIGDVRAERMNQIYAGSAG